MSRIIDREMLIQALDTIGVDLISPDFLIIHEDHDIVIQHTLWGEQPETFSFTEIFCWMWEYNEYNPDNSNNIIGCRHNCARCLTPKCDTSST